MAAVVSTEQAKESLQTIERAPLLVNQPQKLESLIDTLNLIDKISEKIGEDHSGDWSGGSRQSGSRQSDDQQAQISARAKAIANLPTPAKMQQRLKKQIRKEAKEIHQEIRQVTNLRKPGAAFRLNKLYSKLRKLNNLLQEILHSSYEVIKRLYIHSFIDEQPLLAA